MTIEDIKSMVLTEEEESKLLAVVMASMLALMTDAKTRGDVPLVSSAVEKIVALTVALRKELNEREGDNYGK